MNEDEKDVLIARLTSQRDAQVVLIEEHIAAQRKSEQELRRVKFLVAEYAQYYFGARQLSLKPFTFDEYIAQVDYGKDA